jgi:hypothetical protein
MNSRGSGHSVTKLYVDDVTFASNGHFGLYDSALASGTTKTDRVSVTASTFSDNGVGVYLVAEYTKQRAFVQGNSFSHEYVGIGGYAYGDSVQYVNVHTNTHAGDLANYYFGNDGTGTQTIVY